MFKDLKINQTVYFLRKGDRLRVNTATVLSVSAPHLDMTNKIGNVNQMLVDVTIEEDGKVQTYAIPDHLSITFFGDSVLAADKSDIIREVESIKAQSEAIIESVDRNKMIIRQADDILAEYSPMFRDKKDTEERFAKIDSSIEELKKMIIQMNQK